MRGLIVCLIACLLALLVIVLRHRQPPPAPPAAGQSSGASQEVYQVRGVVKELLPGGQAVKIRHDRIPGYMEAMTMPFDVKNTNELRGLQPGDVVTFRMIVTPDDGWIENVVKIGHQAPPPDPIRVAREVEPLNVGDPMPDYHFTNELGQPLLLSQFKGQAVALAFFYTRCPYPDFCPRTSRQLAETMRKLKTMANAPTNWHLLSISFDPGFDTPQVLRSCARQYRADPQCWHFVTGAVEEIDAITEQFGMLIAPTDTGFDHNLRTAVVDAKGRVQKIFQGNQWQAEALVAELIKAAAAN